MGEQVSSLVNVTLRGAEYIFLLVNESDHMSAIQTALRRNVRQFGANVGLTGRVVQAHEQASRQVYEDILGKPWPPQIADHMGGEDQPFLIMIRTDFEAFNPAEDDWRILWFSTTRSPRDRIPRFFGAVERSVEAGRDLFTFLDGIRNPITQESIYGRISSPDAVAVPEEARRGGRPGVLDPEHGVRARIDRMIEEGRITDFSHGWKLRLAHYLYNLSRDLDLVCTPKSLNDALRRAGIYDEIEERLNQNREN